MSLLSLFELAKLTITAFADPGREKQLGEPFEAQYNPSSLSLRHAATLDSPARVSGSSAPQWRYNEPARVSITLVLDGTNVGEMGLVSLLSAPPTVQERVDAFLQCCTKVDAESHAVPFLRLTWSTKLAWSAQPNPPGFDCRLQSVEVRYTAFDRDGSPLRAELAAVFVEQLDPELEAANKGLKSPDLTHRRVVKSGDTLPLLCRDVYGSSHHYLRVAEVNGLDHFRTLAPGSELIFPPFQKQGRR